MNRSRSKWNSREMSLRRSALEPEMRRQSTVSSTTVLKFMWTRGETDRGHMSERTSHASVETSTCVSIDNRRDSIEKYGSAEQWCTSREREQGGIILREWDQRWILLGVEIAKNGDDNANRTHGGNLVARADQRREENRMCWLTKDITMHLLPTIFVAQITFLRTKCRWMFIVLSNTEHFPVV